MPRKIDIETPYTPFHSPLLERLIESKLCGSEFQCSLFIYRKTVGFNKDKDGIPLSQFTEATGLTRRGVCKTLQKLEEKNIICRERKFPGDSTKYMFNRKFRSWRVGNGCSLVGNKKVPPREQTGTKPGNNRSHSIKNKRNLSKERPSPLKKNNYLG
ncbi:MAG: replication protein [Planctomycetota bacterium]|jgi:phage replication O-like protein O